MGRCVLGFKDGPGDKARFRVPTGVAADTDGVGEAARFGTPEGIAIGLNGELSITDLNNAVIRKIVVSERR